jgi:3-oxoacyl-[acyl-carrier protein] reductase
MAKLGGPNVKGRVLITGASRGIGRAIALQLATAGFPVTLNYRQRHEEAERTQALVRDLGGDAALLPFDVADREACAEALESDLAANGAFFGVVCNAGVHEDAPFPGLKGEAWDHVIRTNLDGFYNVVQPLVMPMVRTRNGGRIVTIASASGVMGNRGQVNYSASKAGLIGATRALALELAKRGITVNSVAPGLIETEMTEGLPVDEISRLIPMRRMGKPKEVAAAVGFLFSAEASYITGQVISVNGGLA